METDCLGFRITERDAVDASFWMHIFLNIM